MVSRVGTTDRKLPVFPAHDGGSWTTGATGGAARGRASLSARAAIARAQALPGPGQRRKARAARPALELLTLSVYAGTPLTQIAREATLSDGQESPQIPITAGADTGPAGVSTAGPASARCGLTRSAAGEGNAQMVAVGGGQISASLRR